MKKVAAVVVMMALLVALLALVWTNHLAVFFGVGTVMFAAMACLPGRSWAHWVFGLYALAAGLACLGHLGVQHTEVLRLPILALAIILTVRNARRRPVVS